MACENCNTASKILFGVAGVVALVGVILMIVAGVAGGEGFEIDLNPANAMNPLVVTESGKGDIGYCLHFKADQHANCNNLVTQTTIKGPGNTNIDVDNWCFYEQEEWEKEHDPPLRKLARFYIKEVNGVKQYGNYQVTSPTPLWVRDLGAEIGEAASGIVAMLGLFIVGVVVFIISCILCCVGCCCMSSGKTQVQVVAAGPGGQVVGQPVEARK